MDTPKDAYEEAIEKMARAYAWPVFGFSDPVSRRLQEEARSCARAAAEAIGLREMMEARVSDFHIAQLRHAYMQLKRGRVINQKAFADGLISPIIAALESTHRNPDS